MCPTRYNCESDSITNGMWLPYIPEADPVYSWVAEAKENAILYISKLKQVSDSFCEVQNGNSLERISKAVFS